MLLQENFAEEHIIITLSTRRMKRPLTSLLQSANPLPCMTQV